MSKHVVVIGAVALGPKSAARFKRLEPESKVTMIDLSSRISYGGCGIPYYVSGEINTVDDLQSTPYHIIRDANFFHINKDIDVLTQTKVNSIDREAKTVAIENLSTGEKRTLSYDKLVIATGSKPNMPPLEGINLQGITPCTNLDEAQMIREAVSAGKVNSAVIVGAGFIGLELAVSLADMWGIETQVVELQDQVLPNFLSRTMASMAQQDLEKNDVTVHLSETVQRFEGNNGHVTKVVTNKREIEADLVILAAGVSPNTELAQQAGLECTSRGALVVNDQMQTSDPDIYSGGDCVVVPNQITGKQGFFPLGSMANRQGRVIGTNLAGGNATFTGAVGSWCVKLFEQSAAGAGLTIENALTEGFDAINVHIEQDDRAHFYPEKAIMSLQLVVDKPTRRVLGIQGLSELGDALVSRVNAVAPLLKDNITVEDISNLEVAYSPPFAAAMDIINALGNVADNVLAGRHAPVQPDEFVDMWEKRDGSVAFFDSRMAGGAAPMLEKYPNEWHNVPNESVMERLNEFPKDKEIVVICNMGLRSYETMLMLNKSGFTNVRSVMGGMVAVSKLGKTL